ncbi:hypothetical protein HDU93_008222 [Gonapodya sp. JEL0774]|nr:hypothetical protein HDU93_008222 [Gonapodya sp. JEL0774]
MRGQEVAYTTRNTAHEIVSFLARNPVASLPSADTLPNLLNQPLPEDAKIPIRQWKLNRLSGDLYSQYSSCTETQLKELFRVVDTSDIEIPNTVDTALIREPPPGSTEASFHYFWDDNIRNVLLFLFGGDAQADRDTSYGTSTGKKRPDFNLIYQNVCVFRGEEKARGVNPHIPRNELSAKLEWFYWDAPYVFGYYAIGPMVNYVALLSPSAPGTQPAVLDLLNFNLSYRSHRICNIVFLMNLRRFIDPVRRMVRWSDVPEFTPLENERRIIVLRSADVLKTFKGLHHQARLKHLLKVYAKLRNANVPHVGNVRDCTPADRKDVSVASVTPRGIPRLPEAEKEGLIAIKCVLETLEVAHQGGNPIYHRDIRWPNVVADATGSEWFLIDWDDAAFGPKTMAADPNTLGSSNHAPEIFQNNHGGEVDIWGVGMLIRELDRRIVNLDGRFVALGESMMATDAKKRPNASDGLREVHAILANL